MKLSNMFIYVQQLDVLGFTVEYRQITLMIICLSIMFFVFKRIVDWFIRKERSIFLTYIISSLFLLVIVFLIAITKEELPIIKTSLKTLSLFGLMLITFSLYQFFRLYVTRNN